MWNFYSKKRKSNVMAKAKTESKTKSPTSPKSQAPTVVEPVLEAPALVAPEIILAVDFDGVLHSYDGNWQGEDVITGELLPGAADFLYEAVQRYTVSVYSVRGATEAGRNAMEEWLYDKLTAAIGDKGAAIASQLLIAEHKPFAHLMIDDRAWRFEGNFPRISDIEKLVYKPFATEHES